MVANPIFVEIDTFYEKCEINTTYSGFEKKYEKSKPHH